jgi:hypothetical protein
MKKRFIHRSTGLRFYLAKTLSNHNSIFVDLSGNSTTNILTVDGAFSLADFLRNVADVIDGSGNVAGWADVLDKSCS